MSYHEFCDHCAGCRPSVIDVATGKVLPLNSPEMQAVMRMWTHDTTYAQRKAFIDVTLHNSRVFGTLKLAQEVIAKIATCLEEHKVIHKRTSEL